MFFILMKLNSQLGPKRSIFCLKKQVSCCPAHWASYFSSSSSSIFITCIQLFTHLASLIFWSCRKFPFSTFLSLPHLGVSISTRAQKIYPRDSEESSPAPQSESISSSSFNLTYGPTLTSIHDYQKNYSFGSLDLYRQSDVSAF